MGLMDRRRFVALSGAIGLPLFWPEIFLRGADLATASSATERVLVLVELQGGNDGLNTVVPYRNDDYARARPRLALRGEQVLPLNDEIALNSALAPWVNGAWKAGELAIVQGVGYDDPNRSHFRSIEIWETGSAADEVLEDGWLARLFSRARPRTDVAADGIVIGRGASGPFLGNGAHTVMLDDPARFTAEAKALGAMPDHGANASLRHLLQVRRELQRAAHVIEEKLAAAPRLGVTFPGHRLGRSLETAARLLAARVPVAAIKVSHGSFDTHSNQAGQHQRLLDELATGLAAFRDALIQAGLWKQVLVMTYSEFGRRVAENGSGGTDHGTAAPHFFMGGLVRGGIHGEHPSLAKLVGGGDLAHTTDYRRLYATVARAWWQLPADSVPLDRRFATLDLVRDA